MSQLNFFKYWFQGFAKYLNSAKLNEVDNLLDCCAESCSKNITLRIYREAFNRHDQLEDFMEYLRRNIDDFHYEIESDRIVIYRNRCGCDLYTAELVDSKHLCTCSEKSLLYNWEFIYGKSKVRVKSTETILNGGERCIFYVQLKALGHY